MVLGNGDEVPMDGFIKIHIKIQQCQSQITYFVAKLNDGVDLILGNDWPLQHKVRLDFESKCCVVYKGRCKITVHVNSMQCHSPNPHRPTALPFIRSIWKGTILFLV